MGKLPFNWETVGDAASVLQLTGLDACRLIALIIRVACNARILKKRCRDFAKYLKFIGDLLEKIMMTDLMGSPETKKLLKPLEDLLRRSYNLVRRCRTSSYKNFWNLWLSNQLDKAEADIDKYLKGIPLLNIVYIQQIRDGHAHSGNEDLDHAIALSLFEEEQRMANNIGGSFQVDNDEELARALQASLDIGSPTQSSQSAIYPSPHGYPAGGSFQVDDDEELARALQLSLEDDDEELARALLLSLKDDVPSFQVDDDEELAIALLLSLEDDVPSFQVDDDEELAIALLLSLEDDVPD